MRIETDRVQVVGGVRFDRQDDGGEVWIEVCFDFCIEVFIFCTHAMITQS